METAKTTYKAIIIDDEMAARVLLNGMLQDAIADLQVVALCENLAEGVKAIRKYNPDLVYLDIEMPGNSGLELLEFFDDEDITFSIIFTTAYSHYAIKAFKLSAIDYLMKPIEQEELVAAFDRFKLNKSRGKQHYQLLKENLQTEKPQKLAVPSGNSFRFIELDHIHYFKAEGSYTQIHFTDGSRLMVSRTLKNFEETINDDTLFFRCHKSFLVRASYIVGYNKSDGQIILTKEITIPISPEKTGELMSLMKLVRR